MDVSSINMLLLVSMGVVFLMPRPINSHGFLYDPPSRSSVWRHPQWENMVQKNYRDMGLHCGGFANHKSRGYKCGVCGDPIQDHPPRENEVGGKYASARWRPITANYTQGQAIVVKVKITAHHKGWFSIKLCPTNKFSVAATQQCLDLHSATLPDGQLNYDLPNTTMPKNLWYNVTFVLPQDLTCDLCVLQWRWHCANRWGTDPATGQSGPGLGLQEEFYGCADVSISPSDSSLPSTVPSQDSGVDVQNLCRDYKLDDGLHVHPTSCRHYIQCNNLHTTTVACPAGSGFSPRFKTCDTDFVC